jgi:cytochrome c peroxidase
LATLKNDPRYSKKFSQIYADGVTKNNVSDAIAEFERALITPNARFDQFLRGKKHALNDKEFKGYQKFKSYGCVSCHQGINVGGNMYQTMGVMGDYFKDRKTPAREADLGRFLITGKEEDKHVFKVPSLRNVASTAPYFHDGSIPTLEAAVDTMAKYQLGRQMSKEDIESIVAFLKTLSGERPTILGGNARKGTEP